MEIFDYVDSSISDEPGFVAGSQVKVFRVIQLNLFQFG